MGVPVVQNSKTIRQTEWPGSESHTERVGQPFGEEINPGFTAATHVRADIEIRMRGERTQQKGAQPAANPRSQSAHCEGDQADVSLARTEIMSERHIALQGGRV